MLRLVAFLPKRAVGGGNERFIGHGSVPANSAAPQMIKNAVAPLNQRVIHPIAAVQRDMNALSPCIRSADIAGKETQIGVAKAVDRLLQITDDKKAVLLWIPQCF